MGKPEVFLKQHFIKSQKKDGDIQTLKMKLRLKMDKYKLKISKAKAFDDYTIRT